MSARSLIQQSIRITRLPVAVSCRALSSSSNRVASQSSTSSPLNQINLEQDRANTNSSQDHVGPFPLPGGSIGDGTAFISAQEREARMREASKSWRQLNGSQKVGFITEQGASLIVVLLGATVASLVLYATGSELFSEASPTKIFEDTTERVKQSQELATILEPPYSFHGANSTNRMRRQRRISHQLSQDSDGNEIMLVRFWVEGQQQHSGQDEYWWDTVKAWVGPLIWEDSTKPGSYQPLPTHPQPLSPPAAAAPPPQPQTWGSWAASGLGSVFGGLVPRLATTGQDGQSTRTSGATMFKRARKPSLGEYSTGEVTAELKKDPATGHFVYQQLYVSIPDNRHPNAYRVDIPTNVVEEPTKGMDRLRFWRKKTYVAA